jgi:hypothetical protein
MAASVFISVTIQSAKRTPRNDEQKNDDRNKRHRAAWASDACASGHLLMSGQLQASGNITVETLIAQPTSNLGRQWRKPWSESAMQHPDRRAAPISFYDPVNGSNGNLSATIRWTASCPSGIPQTRGHPLERRPAQLDGLPLHKGEPYTIPDCLPIDAY